MPEKLYKEGKPSLLSILMPVYNEQDCLRKCVEAVISVPLPEGLVREIAMVDDASDDGTQKIEHELADE